MTSTPPWKRLFTERFDPQRTLKGADLQFFVERPGAPSKEIPRRLVEEPGKAIKFFLSGSPGCGKSTEVAQIGSALYEQHAPVGLDVYTSAASMSQVSGSEILFMLGAAILKVAKESWGCEVSDKARKELFDAFQKVAAEPHKLDLDRLVRGTATFASAGLGMAGQALAAAGLMATTEAVLSATPSRITLRPFGGLTRNLREGDPEVDRLAQALASIVDEAHAAIGRPVVLLVDGLDKLEDADCIQRLFVQTRMLDLPTCPVVYNGPISLWLDPSYMALVNTARFECFPLPNCTIEDPVPGSAHLEPKELAEGRDLLRTLVARRLQADDLVLEDVFDPGSLDILISASGGVLRDLVHLVHRACRQASRLQPVPQRIDDALAQFSRTVLAREIQPGVALSQASLDELAFVERQGRTTGTPHSLQLLLRGAILAYQNDRPFLRVHPLLRPLLDA